MKASLQLQPMYCSRDHNYSSRFNQQYEKSTQYFATINIDTFISADVRNLEDYSEQMYEILLWDMDLNFDINFYSKKYKVKNPHLWTPVSK